MPKAIAFKYCSYTIIFYLWYLR